MSPENSKLRVSITALLVIGIIVCCFVDTQPSAAKAVATRQPLIICSSVSSSQMFRAQTMSNDSNWAGYIVASDLQNPAPTVTSVSAYWTVPSVVLSPNNTFSAAWIGIGGYFDQTLIQTGTEQDCFQGQGVYSAWIELLPQTAMTIDAIDVSPGDQMNASVQLVDPNIDEWSIYMEDLTTNQTFQDTFYYSSSQLSAEWIVERPEITSRRSHGTIAALADVGLVEFTDCKATVDSNSGPIDSFPIIQSIMYQTVEKATKQGITQLAEVSVLTQNGSSFTVQTSPSAIQPSPSEVPELSVLILLLTFIAAGLVATIVKKRQVNLSFLNFP